MASVSIGRIAAAVAVLGLTAVSFVSCSAGPIKVEFKGHEILRNVPPDVDGKSSKRDRDKSLFEDKDAWLHWVYIAATVAAVASVLVVRRAAVATAVVGLVATIVFLIGFNATLTRELGEKGKKDKDAPGMSLELGAYMALIGFAVCAGDGVAGSRRRGESGSG